MHARAQGIRNAQPGKFAQDPNRRAGLQCLLISHMIMKGIMNMLNFVPKRSIARAACHVVVATCLIAVSARGLAAPPPKVATGQKLAEQYCALCHVVVPNGPRGWTNAPTFESVANRKETTAASLSAFIQKPHMHMVNTERPKVEADAIAAYIVSLRKN